MSCYSVKYKNFPAHPQRPRRDGTPKIHNPFIKWEVLQGGRHLPISTDPLVSGVPFRRHPLISFCLSPSFSIVGSGRGFMLNQLRLIISIGYGGRVLTAVAHKTRIFDVGRRIKEFLV